MLEWNGGRSGWLRFSDPELSIEQYGKGGFWWGNKLRIFFWYTGISHFWKLILHYLAFMKDAHWHIPIFTDWKKSEDFCFHKKRWEVKIVFSICFAASHNRSSTHPKQWQCHHPASSLGTTLSISASKLPLLWTLWICVLSPFIVCVN